MDHGPTKKRNEKIRAYTIGNAFSDAMKYEPQDSKSFLVDTAGNPPWMWMFAKILSKIFHDSGKKYMIIMFDAGIHHNKTLSCNLETFWWALSKKYSPRNVNYGNMPVKKLIVVN